MEDFGMGKKRAENTAPAADVNLKTKTKVRGVTQAS
jgi:hypothetical protein